MKGAGNSHPRDTSAGNRNPAPPVVVTGGNGSSALPEGTNRTSQSWNKSGIFSAGVSSRARVTELKLPPTHPLLTPWPRTKPSPGTQPWKCTKQDRGRGKARNSSFNTERGTTKIIIYVRMQASLSAGLVVSREKLLVSIATHHQALACSDGGGQRKRS